MNRLEIAANTSNLERLSGFDSDVLVACTPFFFAGAAVAAAGAAYNVIYNALGRHHVDDNVSERSITSIMSVDNLISHVTA